MYLTFARYCITTLTRTTNLENLNAEFIKMGFEKHLRLSKLNDVAIYQMQLLVEMPALSNLPSGDSKDKIGE